MACSVSAEAEPGSDADPLRIGRFCHGPISSPTDPSGQSMIAKSHAELADGADRPRHGRPPHWRDREGTWDRRIFKEVVEDDEYVLPFSFDPLDVVMDVGAHLGSFSWACLHRGAGRVFAYEVDPANFSLLEWNLRPRRNSVSARNVAVWRSDTPADALFYTPDARADDNNTGALRVHNHTGYPVPGAISLDSAIREAASMSDNGRIRLVKLDVEGSEYPILYTTTKLELIDELVGEYHPHNAAPDVFAGLPPFTMKDLGAYLRRCGFTVSWADKGHEDPGFGIFHATRSSTGRADDGATRGW